MKRTFRTALGVAAGLALAAVAVPARADRERGFDGDRDCERCAVPAPAAAYPAPYAHAPAPLPVVAPPYRHAHWRGREWQELRHEYRRLEQDRDRFYATWDHNPWRRSRFEAWYAARRAGLDRRWAEPERG